MTCSAALQKNSELHLGVLSPVIDERGNYLSLNVLPFAEDLRMHEFAPLPSDCRFEPAAEACAAAESLIESMMFGSAAAPPKSFAATGDSKSLHNPTLRCATLCCVSARGLTHTTPAQAILRIHEAGRNSRIRCAGSCLGREPAASRSVVASCACRSGGFQHARPDHRRGEKQTWSARARRCGPRR